jgi:hypothetical protein
MQKKINRTGIRKNLKNNRTKDADVIQKPKRENT